MVRIIVLPCFAFVSNVHTARRETGSTPDVGSSRYTTFGSPISASATDSFLFCPPDNFVAMESTFSPRPRAVSSSTPCVCALFLGMPRRPPNNSTCSITVISSNKTSCWGQTPATEKDLTTMTYQHYPTTMRPYSTHPSVI